jgi:hypothetical protein
MEVFDPSMNKKFICFHQYKITKTGAQQLSINASTAFD